MRVRIVGVHGVWKYRPELTDEQAAQELAAKWSAALQLALDPAGIEVDLHMAYYAPQVNPVLAQAGGDGLDELPDEAYHMVIAWAEQLDALPADTPMGPATVPLRWVVDKMADHRGVDKLLLRPFVATFARETYTYLRQADSPARTGARSVVAEAIRAHRPHIVLAHSFGSVVCYESQFAHPDLNLALLVTLGSPLGLGGAIFDRLQPAPVDGRGTRPPRVQRWVNIADPGDIVAIPRPFTRRFTPDHNHEDTYIHPLAFHTATHYLPAKPTIETIVAYCTNQPTQP